MSKSIILSTGNIVSGGPSIVRKNGAYRSNLELTNSLRSNFQDAKEEYAFAPADAAVNGIGNGNGNGTVNGNGTGADHHTPASLWTQEDGDVLYVPRINWDVAGLLEEPSQYDVTAKLFFQTRETSPSARARQAREALALVRQELHIDQVDLLIVSFPGMSFEGDCEWEADKTNATQGDDDDEWATWAALEPLQQQQAAGGVRNLGIAEFGSEKLARLVGRAAVKPAVDQINIRNCCNVPPPLVQLAKEHGIELLVHGDCTDVLPQGVLRELLGPEPKGAGVLAGGPEAGANGNGNGLRGDLVPQWVIKYTAVVRDRGVIENKGYFAGAELRDA